MKELLSTIIFEESLNIESILNEHGRRTPPKCKTCCRVVHSECPGNDQSQRIRPLGIFYNGYPIFGDVIMNSIRLEELAGLITRKK